MLKHNNVNFKLVVMCQPPLGGCVLKLSTAAVIETWMGQPPLGGCVLKQFVD